jgi:hypothetical protein
MCFRSSLDNHFFINGHWINSTELTRGGWQTYLFWNEWFEKAVHQVQKATGQVAVRWGDDLLHWLVHKSDGVLLKHIEAISHFSRYQSIIFWFPRISNMLTTATNSWSTCNQLYVVMDIDVYSFLIRMRNTELDVKVLPAGMLWRGSWAALCGLGGVRGAAAASTQWRASGPGCWAPGTPCRSETRWLEMPRPGPAPRTSWSSPA